jgi:hypothetical protein
MAWSNSLAMLRFKGRAEPKGLGHILVNGGLGLIASLSLLMKSSQIVYLSEEHLSIVDTANNT